MARRTDPVPCFVCESAMAVWRVEAPWVDESIAYVFGLMRVCDKDDCLAWFVEVRPLEMGVA